MSVMVATAYMDEAERFDWLVAMNAGKVLATGTPAEVRESTGEPTLEKAFIKLLPEEARRGHKEPVITPYVPSGGPPAIESHGLTQRFGDFTAVDHVDIPIETRRDLRIPRLQRLRQDDDDEDADRPAAAHRGHSAAVRQGGRRAATSSRGGASASCPRRSRSTPS